MYISVYTFLLLFIITYIILYILTLYMHIHKFNDCFYLFTSVAYYTEVYVYKYVFVYYVVFYVHFCHCFYTSQIYYICIGTRFILYIKHRYTSIHIFQPANTNLLFRVHIYKFRCIYYCEF